MLVLSKIVKRLLLTIMKTLLIIADSPTLETGFGRVCKNLLNAWLKAGVFDSIEIWGIGYTGWPHVMSVKIYPAQSYEAANWCSPVNLVRLSRLIEAKKFSHIWVMQDLFLLSSQACMETLGAMVERGSQVWGMETTCYFPVDAPVDDWWCDFLKKVNRPVAYTRYGQEEIGRFMGEIEAIPHGTDINVYHPLDRGNELIGQSQVGFRHRLRKQLLVGCEWHEDDFLVINVNQNQRRKGLLQTLLTFVWLMGEMPDRRLKLYMHMRSVNEAEGIDLKVIARELNLEESVMFGDAAFAGGKALMSESGLNMLYNAADLLLTTTHGEGWGLSVTEAMAAGCPVAAPRHTSLKELLGDGNEAVFDSIRGIIFDTIGHVLLTGDNNRLRPITDVSDAVRLISEGMENPRLLVGHVRRALEWIRRPEFRWDAIAARFYGKESNEKHPIL